LSEYVHVGWIGGAARPGATDWETIFKMKPREVVVIADNDREGKAAADRIARDHLRGLPNVKVLKFTDDFAPSFDLGDFNLGDGARYIPERAVFTDFLHAATFQTITVVSGQIARAIDESEMALLKSGHHFFVRAEEMVFPVLTELPASDDSK